MSGQYASGKKALAICDRCGFQFRLKELKALVVKMKQVNTRVCRGCFDKDHPQLLIGLYPVVDPQAVQNTRPDSAKLVAGLLADNTLSQGFRQDQWGWNPIGGGNSYTSLNTPNALVAQALVGTVVVVVS